MREIDIFGDNRFDTFAKTRSGSRGIVLRDGNILLSWERNTGVYMLPGGGLEAGETPEDCCVREVREETGCIVRPVRCAVILREYYEECRYISHYFLCEIVGQGEPSLTKQEEKRGLTPRWMPLAEAVALFGRHADYAAEDEEKRGIFLREYTALTEYLKEE